MIYRDESLNLSLQEAQRALRKAGIPLDPAVWDKSTLGHAERVLDKAQCHKINKAIQARTAGRTGQSGGGWLPPHR